jgi:hypothetical protein
MNETEKDRILRMVSDGTLRPAEAAHLLAALSEPPTEDESKPAEKKEKSKPKQPLMEVELQRADGTHYKVEVPPNLVPMFWQIAKVAIRESARTTARETWSGFKHIVRTKTKEVRTSVHNRVSGGSKPEAAPASTPAEMQQTEARRQILQMVQNGRISATDAGRLIQQLDALHAYERKQSATAATGAK